jgi:hypothetical protein
MQIAMLFKKPEYIAERIGKSDYIAHVSLFNAVGVCHEDTESTRAAARIRHVLCNVGIREALVDIAEVQAPFCRFREAL